ncbi:uncharacterized protein LOC121376909 [Gigantopelta aegis]|uniref:uncharacterized protein LOC121376909 n=1 Tax=Gigantopelta aegis TaxID=1735272 RepID=UPI001B889936|nr:uncharacterized protein LOC121376909 [Gigantopelta aegis]
MAANNPPQDAVFKSSAGLKVTITDGDILGVHADVLVTRENPDMSPASELCLSFCRNAGIKTADWIHDVKKIHRQLEPNTVISKHLGKHGFPYTHVFHVIVESSNLSTEDLDKLYLDVLSKAEKFQVQSLVMPLLVSEITKTPSVDVEVCCNLCLDVFTDPRGLFCGHTFCLQCLQNHIKTSARRKSFQCPNCRTMIKIPNYEEPKTSWASQFPRIMALTDAIAVINRMKI